MDLCHTNGNRIRVTDTSSDDEQPLREHYTENRGGFWDYDYEPHEVPLSVLSAPISDEEFENRIITSYNNFKTVTMKEMLT